MMNSKNLVTLNEPNSFITESYKMLRTNLNYLNIDGNNRLLMIASSTSGEGKTTTIANLAITMAKDGKKILLIDCDLRRPMIHEVFRIRQTPGLTNLIFDNLSLTKVVQHSMDVDGLDILTSGTIPISASDFIDSEQFKDFIDSLKELYDVILIDTPPIISVTDATIISQYMNGVIITVSANQTKKALLSKSIKALSSVNANVLGFVITKDNKKIQNSYYNKKYYNIGQDKQTSNNWLKKLARINK